MTFIQWRISKMRIFLTIIYYVICRYFYIFENNIKYQVIFRIDFDGWKKWKIRELWILKVRRRDKRAEKGWIKEKPWGVKYIHYFIISLYQPWLKEKRKPSECWTSWKSLTDYLDSSRTNLIASVCQLTQKTLESEVTIQLWPCYSHQVLFISLLLPVSIYSQLLKPFPCSFWKPQSITSNTP